jgi:predicted lipoprotein
MKRLAVIAVLVIVAAVIVWRYPLFHIVRTDQAAADSRWGALSPAFDAAQYAESFWSDKLVPSLEKAVNADELLSLYESDPQQARRKFGRSVGVSRQTLFVVQADGTIVSIDNNGVGVDIGGSGGEADILLETGPLFGNTVRDCSGLIRAGDFPNSQQYNELSVELNRIVETRTIAPLAKNAKIGQKVHVAGCAEVSNNESDVKPLSLIPLQIRFEKPPETRAP